MKCMGLDVGSKTVGVAVSDDFGWTAQPVTTIRRKGIDSDFKEIADLIDEYNITEIVIGLPKSLDGSLGKSAQKVMAFADHLKNNLNVPISFWDERMSTKVVTRTLIEADVSRKKRKQVIDKLAASYILQGYLDFKVNQGDKV